MQANIIPSCGPLIMPVDAVCVRTIPSPARLCVFSVLVSLNFECGIEQQLGAELDCALLNIRHWRGQG